MQETLKAPEIVADFFTQGYRVSGAFPVRNQTLFEAVFDPNTNYLLIRDAYLSTITDPASIRAYYETALLDKSNLDFVMTVDSRDALRRDQRYRAASMYEFSIAMTVPLFELQGLLSSVSRSFDPRTYLSNEAGPFITLMDVTARCTFNPEIQYQGGAALINRETISVFGEKSETTP